MTNILNKKIILQIQQLQSNTLIEKVIKIMHKHVNLGKITFMW